MAEGAWIIIGVTVCVVAVLIFFCWIIDRGVQPDLDEPYGDASDTPKMLLDAKRANHKRGL